MINVLLVSNIKPSHSYFQCIFHTEGIGVPITPIKTVEEATVELKKGSFTLVVLDCVNSEDVTSIIALARAQETAPEFLVICPDFDETQTRELTEAGARFVLSDDFLMLDAFNERIADTYFSNARKEVFA